MSAKGGWPFVERPCPYPGPSIAQPSTRKRYGGFPKMPPRVDVSDLFGLPFAHGGRLVDGALPLGGIDCWGVVCEVRRRAGLWTPDPWGCGPDPKELHPEGLPEQFTRHMVTLDAPSLYCVVEMRSPWPGGHAGVLLPGNVVMEANRHAGVVCPPLDRVQRRLIRYLEFIECP